MNMGKSSGGLHEPYDDPIRVLSSPLRPWGSTLIFSPEGGAPTTTHLPPGARASTPCSIARELPTATMTTSAPPPVAERTASAMSWPEAEMTAVAPSFCAASSLMATGSTATIGYAPAILAAITELRPTPPQPITATLWPHSTRAVRSTAPAPVVTAQPTSVAACREIESLIFIAALEFTTTSGLKVDGPLWLM